MEDTSKTEEIISKYLSDYIDAIKALFEADSNHELFELVKLTEQKIINADITLINNSDTNSIPISSAEILSYFKSNQIVAKTYEDITLSDLCLKIYHNIDTSKPDRESKGIKTWFRYEENIRSITICGRCQVRSDLFHILAVLAEFDLMKTFISSFEDITLLGNVTPFRMLVQTKLAMPLMFTNRDLVIEGFGVVNSNEKWILMPVKSVTSQKYYSIDIPDASKKYVRIEMVQGFFHFKHIQDDLWEITNMYNVDPKIAVVPWIVINTVCKEINYYILSGLKRRIEDEKSREIYNKRIEERKEFYDMIYNRMKNFL